MDEIKDIFSSGVYAPFLQYCERHRLKNMADLTACPFATLAQDAGISPSLVSRIKTTFLMYYRKNMQAVKDGAKAAPKRSTAPVARGLEQSLSAYFQQNPGKLIHISDLTKAAGPKAKRSEILNILEKAAWCKLVDNVTFFYAPQEA